MQDIAGCRLVVANVVEQEQLIASLSTAFPGSSIIDRRDYPSYGYRAVHIIVEISGKPVEIQLRTQLQHMWAEVSEKSSDVLDSTIKYGGGPAKWRDFLAQSSKSVMVHEDIEKLHFEEATATQLLIESREKAAAEMIEHNAPEHELQEMQQQLVDLSRQIELRRRLTEELQGDLVRSRKRNADLLNWAISTLN
jgi:ppGpp synthetase/RelA/SpoT-type nucleotidyltranferase